MLVSRTSSLLWTKGLIQLKPGEDQTSWCLDHSCVTGPGVPWSTHGVFTHLDVLPKQVGVEAEPVSGDVESTLQQDVPQQRTGVN